MHLTYSFHSDVMVLYLQAYQLIILFLHFIGRAACPTHLLCLIVVINIL
jgi:hypothetical protein